MNKKHTRFRSKLLVWCTLASLCLALVPIGLQADTEPKPQSETESLLRKHTLSVQGFYVALQQVLGPLPAIAGTPFLGLGLLSGAALLSETELVRESDNTLVRAFRQNTLIVEARRYSTPPLVVGLAALALLSFLANSGKIQGTLGKLIRVTEDWIVGVSFSLLALLALSRPAAEVSTSLTQMGFVGTSTALLAAVAVALGLAAMMIVRLACDVLVWLSPVPFVDFFFESIKNVLSVGFMAIYIFSPTAALLISTLVLLVSLLCLRWAIHILAFAYQVIVSPLLCRLVPRLRPKLIDSSLARPFVDQEQLSLSVEATVLEAPDLKKRQRGVLLKTAGKLKFCYKTWRRAVEHELPVAEQTLKLGRCLGWIELQVVTNDAEIVERYALPNGLSAGYAALLRELQADDLGDLGYGKLVRNLFGQPKSGPQDALGRGS